MGNSVHAFFFYGIAWESKDCPCPGCVDFWANFEPDGDTDGLEEVCFWEWKMEENEELIAAKKKFGVSFDYHCRGQLQMRMLSLDGLIWGGSRGNPCPVELDELDLDEAGHNLKIRRFCEAINLDITDQRIGWWVAPYSEE